MTETDLTAYLRKHYPQENEACEWKEFRNLKNRWNSRKRDDVESYISAIANINGGHLVPGVKDKTLEVVGIEIFGDYAPDNARQRLAGRCSHLDVNGLKSSFRVLGYPQDCLGHPHPETQTATTSECAWDALAADR